MNKRTKYIILTLAAILGLLLMGRPVLNLIQKESREEENREKEESEKEKTKDTGPRLLTLTDSQIVQQHITFVSPCPASLKKFGTFPGEVTLDAERVARVSARFAGVVREVKGNLGDNVKKGQVLAVLESNESLSSYEIKAPLTGNILEKKIKVGEVLKEEDTAFVLADLSTVWVDFHLYPKDVKLVKYGKAIAVEGPDGEQGRAVVTYVEPIADAESRTVHIRAEIQNVGNRWRPGLFVKGRIVIDSARVALSVPEEAVQSLDGHPCVFVRTPKGLKPIVVETGLSDGEKMEIKSGLTLRDTLISENAYLIKSEFEKGSFKEEEGDEDEEKKRDKD